MIVQRIDPMSLAKVMGILYAALGLIAGAFLSLFSLMFSGMARDSGFGAVGGLMFGAGAIVVLPIFYGVIGFVGGIISAAIYNVVAGWVGGIELDLVPKSTPSS